MADITVNSSTSLNSDYWDDTSGVSDQSLDCSQGVQSDILTAALAGMANAQKDEEGESTASSVSSSTTQAAASTNGTSVDETSEDGTLAAPTGASPLNGLDDDETKKRGFNRLRHHHNHV